MGERSSRRLGKGDKFGKSSTFETAVVVEFIGNPENFLQETVMKSGKSMSNLDLLRSSGFSNSDMADVIPHGSVIAMSTNPIKSRTGKMEMLFPFFPSHIGLPVKPGEKIWVYYNEVNGRSIGYWICRQVGAIIAEDLNYTHVDRIIDFYEYIANPDASDDDLVRFLSPL